MCSGKMYEWPSSAMKMSKVDVLMSFYHSGKIAILGELHGEGFPEGKVLVVDKAIVRAGIAVMNRGFVGGKEKQFRNQDDQFNVGDFFDGIDNDLLLRFGIRE